MLKKFLLLSGAVLLITSSNIFSQSKYLQKSKSVSNHSHQLPPNWNWDWDWNYDSNPMIELTYGKGKPKHAKFDSDFSKIGLAEIKLGFTSVNDFCEDYLIEYRDKFFYASNISTDLKSKNNDPAMLNTDMWRFGFGWRNGYGYAINAVSLIPYIQYSLNWSKLQMKEFPDSTFAADLVTIDKYHDSFRFGVTSEAGIKLDFDSFIALNASYEASVIFPRHLFWKHAGSVALEAIGMSTIDYFIDEVIDSSPAAGPVLNFVLKAGYMYAFYHLKKDKMNWPFDSEAPLTYETFKIGTTFVF